MSRFRIVSLDKHELVAGHHKLHATEVQSRSVGTNRWVSIDLSIGCEGYGTCYRFKLEQVFVLGSFTHILFVAHWC